METSAANKATSTFSDTMNQEKGFMLMRAMLENGSDAEKEIATKTLNIMEKASSAALCVEVFEEIVGLYSIVDEPEKFVQFLREMFKWKNVKIQDIAALKTMLELTFSNMDNGVTFLDIRQKVRGFVMGDE
jgi:hypothetical protein